MTATALPARRRAAAAALVLLAPLLAAVNARAEGAAPAAEPAALAPAESQPSGEAGPRVGPETNLPLPRFVTLTVDRANLRRGPSTAHRIDWVFTRRGAPLEVIAEHGLWRRVRDQDDSTGWIHHAMLRNWRSAVVTAAPETVLRRSPDWSAAPVAKLETGVTARLDACEPHWCLVETSGVEGWAPKADIWGVKPGEVFD